MQRARGIVGIWVVKNIDFHRRYGLFQMYNIHYDNYLSLHCKLFPDWFKSENSQKSRHRILLYESCSLIGLNPGIPKNLGIEFTTCSSTYNFQFSDPLKLKKLTFPNPQKLYRYSPCISEYTSRKNHVFINRSY